ncbi:alpha/beta fold hydrolase [uncultured Helicobacter sp.]|uniref:alpha/beta fold hydrolase n=1 Tax=uncultured Helicobacter sp. TaxID=175537 RepID=UPI002626881D|nr:alpha/beta fold hydrolase [uncultured Helicobacter sp.]
MSKNIQTYNAKIGLIGKFLDYANCADASYALLHYVNENAENETQENKADNLTFGDKLEQDIEVTNHKGETIIKPKGTNTAYACAIEARFNEGRTGDWCIPFANKCLTEKDKISNNDITQVALDSKLSKRTITFTNRFRILAHQENTSSGFSATLFEDTKVYSKDSQYILSIRGTEFKLEQIQDLLNDYYIGTNNSDMNRVIEQYFDMLLFYEETLKPLLQEKGIARINVIGHSLGGYLAQLFALSYPSIINEVYTYNTSLESKSVA